MLVAECNCGAMDHVNSVRTEGMACWLLSVTAERWIMSLLFIKKGVKLHCNFVLKTIDYTKAKWGIVTPVLHLR